MKIALLIGFLAVGIFIFLIAIMLNPLHTEVANLSISEANATVSNFSEFDGYRETVGIYPVAAIVIMAGLIFYGAYSILKR